MNKKIRVPYKIIYISNYITLRLINPIPAELETNS